MNARELIKHVSQSDQRLTILRELRRRPGSISEIVERASTNRTPVYTAFERLEQCGGIVSVDGQRRVTVAGDVVIGETAAACDAIGREAVAYLASSKGNSRLTVMDGLSQSLERCEMNSDEFPSRSTITRSIEGFEAFGWITKRPNSELTELGKKVFETYTDLIRIVEIVVDKISYFQHVDPSKVNLPIELLADAEVVEGLPNRPNRGMERTRSRLRESFHHIRIISSYYSESEVGVVYEAIDEGATVEVISPFPAHIPLPTSAAEIRHFRKGLGTSAVSWKVYPDELPLDLIIFDNKRVILGTHVDFEAPRVSAVIDSTNAELVQWAIDLYDLHVADASRPLDYLLKPIQNAGLYKALRVDQV